jgi:methionyl-tRNA synthetase
MIEPYLPSTAARMLGFFGLEAHSGIEGAGAANGHFWEVLGKAEGLSGTVKSEVLFTKLEDDQIAALRDRYSGTQKERADAQNAAAASAAKTDVSGTAPNAAQKNADTNAQKKAPKIKTEPPVLKIPEEIAAAFGAVMDLRAAKITAIARHPNAEKLYIETLEITGDNGAAEERTIVSGLVPFYKEEELLGKHIIVAYNLKAAKLRGVESKGMLLAASVTIDGKETVEVLDAGDVPLGTRVVLEGQTLQAAPPEISIDTFFTIPLEVKNFTVCAGGKALTLNGSQLTTRLVEKGEVH